MIDQVFVATDDTDAGFLEEIRGRGWKMVDESTSLRIRREWGDWYVWNPRSFFSRLRNPKSDLALSRWVLAPPRYPTLIDNVLLSMGAGFVGA